MELLTMTGTEATGGINPERSRQVCRALEEARVVFFPQTPVPLPADDLAFLLDQRQAGGRHHKNVAYRPLQDRVTGVADRASRDRLRAVLGGYSRRVRRLIEQLLAAYDGRWRLDYASFRPQQEEGRVIRTRARNDLLHVDSFPTRPTSGDRILRFFNNINPDEGRRWIVGEPFDRLLGGFTDRGALLDLLEQSEQGGFEQRLRRLARRAGLPVRARPPYDEFMLRLHHRMKEDAAFQRSCVRREVIFPPGSSWMCYTDAVPHAVLSGRFALEQTFIVSRQAMLAPELAPAAVVAALRNAR